MDGGWKLIEFKFAVCGCGERYVTRSRITCDSLVLELWTTMKTRWIICRIWALVSAFGECIFKHDFDICRKLLRSTHLDLQIKVWMRFGSRSRCDISDPYLCARFADTCRKTRSSFMHSKISARKWFRLGSGTSFLMEAEFWIIKSTPNCETNVFVCRGFSAVFCWAQKPL